MAVYFIQQVCVKCCFRYCSKDYRDQQEEEEQANAVRRIVGIAIEEEQKHRWMKDIDKMIVDAGYSPIIDFPLGDDLLSSILRRVDRPPSISRRLNEKSTIWIIFLINYYSNKQGYELGWNEKTDRTFLRKLSAEEERALRHTPSMDNRSDIQFEYHVYGPPINRSSSANSTASSHYGRKSKASQESKSNGTDERRSRGFGKKKEWKKKKTKDVEMESNSKMIGHAKKIQHSSALGTGKNMGTVSAPAKSSNASQSAKGPPKRGQRRANQRKHSSRKKEKSSSRI